MFSEETLHDCTLHEMYIDSLLWFKFLQPCMLTLSGADKEELRPHQEGEAQELETAGDGQRP